MTRPSPPLWQRLATNYVVSFLLWLVATGLIILDFIYGRLLLMALVGLTPITPGLFIFIDRVSLVVLGLVGLILVLYLEHYYRTGVKRQQLWPRFLRVSLVQIGIILVGLLFSWLPTYLRA